jgi:cytochrome P450
VLQALQLWHDPKGALQRWAARYGPLFTLTLPAVGRFVVVSDPRAVHRLLQSDPAASHAGEATGRVLSLLGRHSILRLDADAHLERRRLLGPVFHGERINDHRHWMLTASGRDLDTWPRGRAFPALPHMQAIAFAVIAHLALGLSDWRRITELQSLISRYSGGPSVVGTWLSPVARPAGEGQLWRAVRRRQAGVDRFLRVLVDERRATRRDAESPHDALGVLLRHQQETGEKLSDGALCDELRALLIVGHDTTAAAMAWALERLTHTPRVLSAVVEAQPSLPTLGETGESW